MNHEMLGRLDREGAGAGGGKAECVHKHTVSRAAGVEGQEAVEGVQLRRQEAGGRRQEAGGRRQEAGGRRQEAGG